MMLPKKVEEEPFLGQQEEILERRGPALLLSNDPFPWFPYWHFT